MEATVYQAVHKILRNFANTFIDPYDCIIFGCGISKSYKARFGQESTYSRPRILKGKQKLKGDIQLFGLIYFCSTYVHNIFE